MSLVYTSGFGSFVTEGLIVHSAYFDERPRNGHFNVTVIFITVNVTIWRTSRIVGCGIDYFNASHFQIYSPMENKEAHKGLKRHFQENLLIFCYDLPAKNGSNVYVFYDKPAYIRQDISQLHSEYPLFFPAPRVKPRGGDHITIITCLKIHNRNAHFLKEIIQYQKTIGVDHVYISVLNEFVEDGGYNIIEEDAELNKFRKEGYLSLKVWTNEEGIDVMVHSEIIRKLECTYRFRGTYDYVMPLDTDDFFIPRVSGKTKLREYIREYCYVDPIASCQFVWVWFYPKCGLTGKVGSDGNVTKHMKSLANRKVDPMQINFKSVHNMTHLLDNGFHDATCRYCFQPGYKTVIVPTHVAYVAHLRYGRKEKIPESYYCNQAPPFQNIPISEKTRKHFSLY